LATFATVIYRQQTMQDCQDAKALADFLWWSQYDSAAATIATRYV
jgi:hypothetical protein